MRLALRQRISVEELLKERLQIISEIDLAKNENQNLCNSELFYINRW